MTTEVPVHVRNRNRWALIAILAIFLVPMLIAGMLRFTDRHPAATRQHGELLQPPTDLRALTPQLVNGEKYAWNAAARTWRIVLAPPANCTAECSKLARDIGTVWQVLGREAERVDVLWLGTPPAEARKLPTLRELPASSEFSAALPRAADAQGVTASVMTVYVIDPNGFVVLRYPPGFDPAGLRADLAKLLKLM